MNPRLPHHPFEPVVIHLGLQFEENEVVDHRGAS
jgi:hypothetical protein